MSLKLSHIGKIYKEHLSIISKQHYVLDKNNVTDDTTPHLILKKCSSKGLCVFAKLTSLMESPFAVNNKKIILTTSDISNRIAEGNLISGRMVKRQIDYFKEAIPHLFKLNSYKNKSYIEINLPDNRSGFINVFALSDQENKFVKDTTVDILLSCLLDKAAFNFRCGYEFFVDPSQLKNLKNELNLSEKTIISTLDKLKNLDVIKVDSEKIEDDKESKNDLLRKEIRFDFQIFNQLKEFIKLTQTEKCLEIKKQREAKTPIQKVEENNFVSSSEEKISEEKNISIQNSDVHKKEKSDEEIIREGQILTQQLNDLFKKKDSDNQNYYSILQKRFSKNEFPTGSNLTSEKSGHPVGKKWLTPQEISSHVSGKNWLSI